MPLLFGKKGRRAAMLGAAGLGGCALLAACSPVQMGAAAIVGNQRITVSSLDSNVSTLKAGTKQYASTLNTINMELQQQQEELPISSTPLPQLVLNWQVNFALANQMAAANGISVTPEQGQAALNSEVKSAGVSENVFLTAIGIPLTMSEQAAQYYGQQAALSKKYGSDTSAFEKSQCTAAKTLNIQVNPQFGRFDYASSAFGIVPGNDVLSRPAGVPSPANTGGLTPAAC